MDEFDEKMKTHVSKISRGSRSSIYPSGMTKSNLDFSRCETQNIKKKISWWIQLIKRFPDLSSDLKLVEQKPRYCNLKILVDSKIRVLVLQLVKLKSSKWVFSYEFLLAHNIHRNLRVQIWMSRTHFIIFWILVIY